MTEIREPFSADFQVAWSDVDAIGHMRNTAYLECVAQTRTLFFEAQGTGMNRMREQGVGPVVLSDTITYRRELRLLDRFRVDFRLSGVNERGTRFRFSNALYADDGALCAEIVSMVVMLDMQARKSVSPTPEFARAMDALARTDDFERLT